MEKTYKDTKSYKKAYNTLLSVKKSNCLNLYKKLFEFILLPWKDCKIRLADFQIDQKYLVK